MDSDLSPPPILLPLSILLFLSSTWFVLHYAKRNTSIFVVLLSIVSFGLGSAAVALLPIDLSYASLAASSSEDSDTVDGNGNVDEVSTQNTNDAENKPENSTTNPTYFPWQVTYWTTFFLAWLLLPITRESLLSGHFTLRQRFKDGVLKSVRGIFFMICAGVISIIAMAIKMRSIQLVETVLPVLMALGNTYGLLLVSLLLGNGLINIPKRFWREACPENELRRARIMACGAEEELFEAVWQLEDVKSKVEDVCRCVINAPIEESGGNGERLGIMLNEEGGVIATDSGIAVGQRRQSTRCGCVKMCHFTYCRSMEVTEFSECLEELVRRKNLTLELNSDRRIERRPTARRNEGTDRNGSGQSHSGDEPVNTMDVNYLVILNAQLKQAQERVASAQLRWDYLMERSRMFSAMIENNGENNSGCRGQRNILSDSDSSKSLPDSSTSSSYYQYKLRHCLQRLWVRRLRFPLYRIMAMVTAVFSFVILWSEVSLAVPINMSPFSWILHSLENSNDSSVTTDGDNISEQQGATQHPTQILFQIFALLPLLYMSLCVYTCLFQLSLLGPFCLRGNRQSHGVALVFNAQYLVRLQFPLGYNYLLILKYDMTHCAFSNIMSDMSTIPFFGTSFTVYAPLLILAVCAFTLCDAYPKMLHSLGVEHEDALLLGDADMLQDKVNEGIQLIQRDAERRGVSKDGGQSPDKSSLVKKESSGGCGSVVV